MIYDIPSPTLSKDYIEALKVAAEHLEFMAARVGMELLWIRADPHGPSLEHLSFFCGGQAYFVRLVDAAEKAVFPGSKEGLLRIAKAYRGFACWMALRRLSVPGMAPWAPVLPDWDLWDIGSGGSIRPEEQALAEPLPVTSWELHDFAVQVVRETLRRHRLEITAWNSDPEVQPAIWFKGASGLEWASVGECLGTPFQVPVPESLQEHASSLTAKGFRGWWGPVGFAPLVRKPGRLDGLYRGEGANVDFRGLMPLPF